MSTVTETPSVRAHIRAAIEHGDSADPRAIATQVIDQLGDEELRDALRMALPLLVADEVRKWRAKAIGAPDTRTSDGRVRGAETHEAFAQPQPVEQAAERNAARRAAGNAGAAARDQRMERDSALLRTPVALGKNEWKPLGDCTADDLRRLSRFNRARAAENERRADGWERLADVLDKVGATTVRQMSGPAIREAFGGEPA